MNGARVQWSERDGRVRTGTVVSMPRPSQGDDFDAWVRPDGAPEGHIALVRYDRLEEVA